MRFLRSPLRTALAVAFVLPAFALAASALAVWRAAHTDDASRVDHADAILVLGAAQYAGDPSPVFAGRLDHALLLYGEGRAPLVIVVGGPGTGDATTEAEAGVAYLRDQGIPDASLVASPRGSTTWESLVAVGPILDRLGVDRVFLVSDPWHNLRAKRMAHDLGIDAYASATWRSAARSEPTRLDGYVRETFAYLVYRVVGG